MWESGSCWCHPSPGPPLYHTSGSVRITGWGSGPTELADELLGGLVDILVGELELLDNPLCFSLERHGERLRDRRGGWKGKTVFANRWAKMVGERGGGVPRFQDGSGEEVGRVEFSGGQEELEKLERFGRGLG